MIMYRKSIYILIIFIAGVFAGRIGLQEKLDLLNAELVSTQRNDIKYSEGKMSAAVVNQLQSDNPAAQMDALIEIWKTDTIEEYLPAIQKLQNTNLPKKIRQLANWISSPTPDNTPFSTSEKECYSNSLKTAVATSTLRHF